MRLFHFLLPSILFCSTITYTNAQTISFPDEKFKTALIALGHDTNGDGNIQKSEVAGIKRLYIDKGGISSLVGIKNFTSLEEFGFYDNSISVVDLEEMANLRAIYGWKNGVTLLKLKGCTKLETIFMNDNNLRAIDVTSFKGLKELRLERNNLERIDVSNLPKLVELWLDKNKIVEFKATGATALKELKMEENYIFELDLRPFKKLEYVYLTDNPLKKINVSGLKSLVTLYCGGRKFPSMINQLNTSGLTSIKNYDW